MCSTGTTERTRTKKENKILIIFGECTLKDLLPCYINSGVSNVAVVVWPVVWPVRPDLHNLYFHAPVLPVQVQVQVV